jgi:hypothetical protein
MGSMGRIRYPDDYPSTEEMLHPVDYLSEDRLIFSVGDFHRYIVDKVVLELQCDEVTIDEKVYRLCGGSIAAQAAIVFKLCEEAINARRTTEG